jgi:hypothetical protein
MRLRTLKIRGWNSCRLIIDPVFYTNLLINSLLFVTSSVTHPGKLKPLYEWGSRVPSYNATVKRDREKICLTSVRGCCCQASTLLGNFGYKAV